MYVQKTFKEIDAGGLFLIATPIGNLDDITLRAIKTLEEIDLLLAEDTRVTNKLLQHLGLKKQLISFHEHNQYEKSLEVIELIRSGKKIGLVSDAGMPCISDPGAILVRQLIEAQLPLTVIPGVSASTALFSVSGMSEQGDFCFHGFLPTKEKAKLEIFKQYQAFQTPVIFYESPHRIVKTLMALKEVFSPETKVCVGRELTKIHETFMWFQLAELEGLDIEELTTWKGEIAFIVLPEKVKTDDLTDEALYQLLLEKVASGMKPKLAMKAVAELTRKKPNELYKIWESSREKNNSEPN